MANKLTKEDILRSAGDYRPYKCEALGGKEINIAPLGGTKSAEVEAKMGETMTMEGTAKDVQKMEGKVRMNVSELKKTKYEANLLAFKFGTEFDWTDEELERIPQKVIVEVGEEIKKISGIQTEKELKQKAKEIAEGNTDVEESGLEKK